MKSATINPVFVLGSARNGTTWLGNCLCGHAQIAGAEDRVHWGQVESKILAHAHYAGRFEDDRKFVAFMEAYAASDYFRLVDGDKESVYRKRPNHFFQLFFDLMDEFASKSGASWWTTKLDPRFFYNQADFDEFLKQLNARYAKPRFISIQRPFPRVLRSYLNMEGQKSIHQLPIYKKLMAVFLESARYTTHYRHIAALITKTSGLALDFPTFKENPEQELRRICEFLELPFDAVMLENRFPANSSFFHPKKKTPRSEKLLYTFGSSICHPWFSVISWPAGTMLRMWDKRRSEQCPMSWRLLRCEHMPDRLEHELEQTGQHALRSLIFDKNGEDS